MAVARAAAPAPAAAGARALRPLAAARAAVPGRPHRPGPLLRAGRVADGPPRDRDLPPRRAALGAPGAARLRDLAADEGRPRRAVRPPAGEGRRHAARGRSRLPARRHARRLSPVRRRGRGAQEPARRRRRRPRARPPARRRGPAEGRAPRRGAPPPRRRGARLRPARRARPALPGGGRVRLPDALRGLRPAGRRGDGLRHAGRRDAATRRCARSGGDAIAYAEPDELAATLERVLADPEKWSRAGLERARRFSWPETARRTVAVYREALQ